MKVFVVNGSPKGEYSITLQSALYLKKLFPEHEFSVLNAGARIRALEKDFSEAKAALLCADLILFSYPVYTFGVPSQLYRFIRLMKENEVDVRGKAATQLSTSLHFYDVTAHAFVEDNCKDLGLLYYSGLSAGMEDLTTKKGQKEIKDWFDHLLFCIRGEKLPADPAKKVALLIDPEKEDTALLEMIELFENEIPYQVTKIDLREFPFQGGCLGCLNCASDGKCIYKDGFDTFLREKIQSADAIVMAFTIRDHLMGYRFKLYDDRQFCNGHRTVTEGMPMGYLIGGDLSAEPNLKMMLEARAQVGGNYLAGLVDSAGGGAGEMTQEKVRTFAADLVYAVEKRYSQPKNFFGVGGMKIFRDLIWIMQGFMKADHAFYKEHGQYDFPQKQWGKMMKMRLLGALVSNPKIKKKLGNKMNEGMIAPYRKVLERDETKR